VKERRTPGSDAAKRGRFITLEGGEGAGKSTQVKYLLSNLREAGVGAIGTREPGGSPGAEILRKVLLSGKLARLGSSAEAILFSAARIDHLENTIKPALAAGLYVISDRFFDSTRAYQGHRGQLDPSFMRALERVTLAGLRPDLTIILDLPAAEGLARAAARRSSGENADRFERENRAFHEALRTAFIEIAAAEPARCIVVNALRAEQQVARDIFKIVSDRFCLGDARLKSHA